MSTKETGAKGELLAEKFLKKQGYKIISRNFKCKFGEIDLVGFKKDTISFIEVKTRSSDEFGQPFEAVDKKKQMKLVKSAQYFIFKNKLPPSVPCQFDIVSILLEEPEGNSRIDFIQNAFTARKA